MQEVMSTQGLTVTVPPSIPTLEEFVSLLKTRNLQRQERFFASFSYFSGEVDDLTLLCYSASLPGKNINNRTIRINGLDERRASTADYTGNSITLSFLVDPQFSPRNYFEKWMKACVGEVTTGREVGFYSDYAKEIKLYALMPAGIPGEKLLNLSPTIADRVDFGNQLTSNQGLGAAINKLFAKGSQKVDSAFARAKAGTIGRLDIASNPIYEAFRQIEDITYTIELKECWPTRLNSINMNYENSGVTRMDVEFTFKYWVSSVDVAPEDLADKANNKMNEFLNGFKKKIPGGSLDTFGVNLKNKITNVFNR